MKLSVDISLSVAELATAFCELDDDGQAKFFTECARIGRSWSESVDFGSRVSGQLQWLEVGKHLRECACSTEDAREMVRDISAGMEPSK